MAQCNGQLHLARQAADVQVVQLDHVRGQNSRLVGAPNSRVSKKREHDIDNTCAIALASIVSRRAEASDAVRERQLVLHKPLEWGGPTK